VNLQRVQTKKMIREWDRLYPGRIDNMFSAMGNITLSHMMDRKLHPFETLRATGRPDPAGDKAFDEDEEEACATSPSATGPAEPQVVRWGLKGM
jgi:tRNA 2-thiocytidine biosynthesis protein TtcA